MSLKGNDSKNSTYLATMLRRTEPDKSHPRHKGIKMQAHHILSAEGVKQSRMGPKLVGFGYDINEAKNLVFLPCTLQGACHLGVQPHRGNHSAGSDVVDDRSYDDDDHPPSYHELVARLLMHLETSIDRRCGGNSDRDAHKVQEMVNDLGQRVLMMIYGQPNRARLTRIADSFKVGHSVGCAGVDNVGRHQRQACPVGRNHFGRQGSAQQRENITFEASRYVPRPGK